MKYTLNDRVVEVDEVEGEAMKGAYAIGAYFEDTGADLTDAELDTFNDKYAESLYQEWYENMASNAYDRAKDAWKYGE